MRTTLAIDDDVLAAARHLDEHVHEWFGRAGRKAFATCPITENGLLRIVGHPRYPNSPGPPSTAAGALTAMRGLPGHAFWADSISLVDNDLADPAPLSRQSRVTDAYLLALARANKGLLATMDQKLATEVVADGKSARVLI